MKRALALVAVASTLIIGGGARADVNPFVVVNLTPLHDTFATHDDGLVHGFETFIRVGTEPQQCVQGGWDPCPKEEKECCVAGSSYNYCAPVGECGATTPNWSAFRKYRGYLRFDLNGLPAGKVKQASLRLTEVGKVSEMGGPLVLIITALKKIGEGGVCEWSEQTLNDTNLTTWSSLPQNLSVTEEGMWHFDVTKAVTDWVNGDADKPGNPIMPNCGFHLYDEGFGNSQSPIQRWVDFGSKESQFDPQLKIELALDLDQDGHFGDCNEEDPAIHPGAIELCDGLDNDCDGTADEEDCDGLDNNCNGLIDEGLDLCGLGQACIYHACYPTCQNECGGPTALTCTYNEGGYWERWGCKKGGDEDPCFDWYFVENCAPGEYCQYGYCSSNCVDTCDVAGKAECYKDSTGAWFVGMCGNYDPDECLDLGDLNPCGPAAKCTDALCGSPCQDECVVGQVECLGLSAVRACYDWDGNGCTEWGEVGQCDPVAAPCDEGECGGPAVGCKDECLAQAVKCEVTSGEPTLFACVANADDDPCLEWDGGQTCPPGQQCNGMGNGCEEPEPPPEVVEQEDVVTAADIGLEFRVFDMGAADGGDAGGRREPDWKYDTGPIPGDLAGGPEVTWQSEEVGGATPPPKKEDGGCQSVGGSDPGAWPLLVLLLGLLGAVAGVRANRSSRRGTPHA